MLAHDLITDEIPTLKISDTGQKAIHWMDEFKVSHLPIVNKREYIGLLCETDILDLDQTEDAIEKYKLSLIRPYVYENDHFYAAIKVISEFKLTALPVIDANDNYVGVIPATELINKFSLLASSCEQGGIIVLEMNEHDYSLSQIAQIVESNNGKILSTYLNSIKNSTKIEVTLKINRVNLDGILQTFSRYDYNVKASFHKNDQDDDMQNRYDSFMNYMNI